MYEIIYKADIGDTIHGRTVEIEAHTSQSAYDQAILQVDRKKCERIIQIRDDRDFVVYCYSDQDSLFPKMRG